MTEKEKQMKELQRRLRKLADARNNDAVKLAFLREDLDLIDNLDLVGLVELKRSDKGCEMKFADPLRVIAMMRELMNEQSEQGAQDFFRALNQVADGDELP